MADLIDSAMVEKALSGQPVATPPGSPLTAQNQDPGTRPGRGRKEMVNEKAEKAQDAAATRLALDDNLNGSGNEDDRILRQVDDEATSAAARAAKDYRAWMLEHVKVSINAALDYANGLVSPSLQSDCAGHAFGQAHERRENSGTPKLGRPLSDPARAAEEYRAKAFELMTANVNATLDYAQRLANVRSPAEFVELSANHACKQLELFMTHAAALGALSQSLTTTNAERLTAGFAKAFGQKKA